VNIFRRLSFRSLLALIGAVAAAGAVAAVVAVTALGTSGSTPPAEPLSQAVHDALSAPPVDGITARIHFTNNLFPSAALGSLAGVSSSPLLSGASGRLWLTGDGHLRLELQSDAGDAQIVSDGTTLTVYDASSNTAYSLALPAQTKQPADKGTPPSVAEIDDALTQLARFADVSGPTPDSVAGQPAYTVSASPTATGGLLGSAQVSWDASTGVPLRVAVYAKGDASPVLELAVSDISYGAVSSSDVDISPPPGAKVVPVTLPTSGSGMSNTPPVTGLDAVAAAVSFPLAAPDTLNGLARSEVRLLPGKRGDDGALVTYGDGPGTIAVLEHAAGANDSKSPLAMLPGVSINGATGHELVTELGTVVDLTSGGVAYTVAGSVTQADAEAAARALTP
jgi:outer membrane lipoprotein-sorting protein